MLEHLLKVGGEKVQLKRLERIVKSDHFNDDFGFNQRSCWLYIREVVGFTLEKLTIKAVLMNEAAAGQAPCKGEDGLPLPLEFEKAFDIWYHSRQIEEHYVSRWYQKNPLKSSVTTL